MDNGRKLRVGFILDDGDQSNAAYELFQKSRQSELYSIVLLIVQRPPKGPRRNAIQRALGYVQKRGIAKTLAKIGFTILARAERILFARKARYAPYFKRYSLDQFGADKLFVEPRASKSGFVYRYSDADLEEIRKRDLDVLIRGGSGILRGEILRVARFGIVSFHHANNRVNRGSPPGFWEVYHGEPSTGFIIQQLSEELDGGDVLFRGAIATSPTYVVNAARLYLKANLFMHALLEQIARRGALPACECKQPYAYPLYTTPDIGAQVNYLFKTSARMGAKLWRKLRGHTHRWGVAYQFARDWRDAVLWRSKVIRNPPRKFLADPFVITRNGRNVIFVEEYDIPSGRGYISAYEVDKNGATALGIALQEPFHLSFPFLLEKDGELYMCPDTHEAKDIRLYRCVEFPLKWQLHRVLMTDVSAADTMVFEHDAKWWMLTNIDSAAIGDHGAELHAFCAETFDSAAWRPHELNPIILDSTRARNGGLLRWEAGLYRVFQVQGFDAYGASMGIAEIKTLDMERFREEQICTIEPRFMPRLAGAHTYSHHGGVLALDFVKFEGAAH
ncbi:MAG: hypothetical protein AB7T59_16125 [Hyphomonadaceae bacterium]